MKDIEALLTEWKNTPSEMVPVGKLQTDARLQARDPCADGNLSKRRANRQQLEEHIRQMLRRLQDDEKLDLEPILAAWIGKQLCVIDGHHRLEAYRRAQRETIPARIQFLDDATAQAAATLVNLTPRAVALTTGQKTQAAWKYLGIYRLKGWPLPAGRALAKLYSLSPQTGSNMVNRARVTEHGGHPKGECPKGSKWPYWRTVGGRSKGTDVGSGPDIIYPTDAEAERRFLEALEEAGECLPPTRLAELARQWLQRLADTPELPSKEVASIEETMMLAESVAEGWEIPEHSE